MLEMLTGGGESVQGWSTAAPLLATRRLQMLMVVPSMLRRRTVAPRCLSARLVDSLADKGVQEGLRRLECDPRNPCETWGVLRAINRLSCAAASTFEGAIGVSRTSAVGTERAQGRGVA